MTISAESFRAAPPAGSRVVIQGAGGGLGLALVEAASTLGLKLALLDLPAPLAGIPTSHGGARIPFDALDEKSTFDAIDAAAASLGGIDHLFNLVGFSAIPPKTLADTSTEVWDRIVNGNLRSAFLGAKAVLPHMAGDRSSIVLVSSTMTVALNKGYGAYIAAKAGMGGMVKALALEIAPKVRVNAVAPSAMLTPFMSGGPSADHREVGKWDWFDPKAAAASLPMGRLCTPADVVGPMLFLASPLAQFMTGQTLQVSGGRVMP